MSVPAVLSLGSSEPCSLLYLVWRGWERRGWGGGGGWSGGWGGGGGSYPHPLSSKEGTFLDAHGEATYKVMITCATLTAKVQSQTLSATAKARAGIKMQSTQSPSQLFPRAPQKAVRATPGWTVGKHSEGCCWSSPDHRRVPVRPRGRRRHRQAAQDVPSQETVMLGPSYPTRCRAASQDRTGSLGACF